jgi:thymidine phosphorylase
LFRLKHLPIDTLREHVVMIHEQAVRNGNLGFNPLDRVRVSGTDPATAKTREITGVLNFCRDLLLEPDQVGLSEEAFRDLGLPESTLVGASLAVAPRSVDLVRDKLAGGRLNRAAFSEIMADVAARRYSRVELAMFVLACALKRLDLAELVDYTHAMIETGEQLKVGPGPVFDKHCIGGVPGNRTTMIVVPILAASGLTVPKTSSRAITSPAGTADTMGVLADVSLSADRIYDVIGKTGACIAWGGARAGSSGRCADNRRTSDGAGYRVADGGLDPGEEEVRQRDSRSRRHSRRTLGKGSNLCGRGAARLAVSSGGSTARIAP